MPALAELESELEDLDLLDEVPFIGGLLETLVISPSSTSSICSRLGSSSLELKPDNEISSSSFLPFSFSLTLLTLLTPERRSSSSGFSTGSTARSPRSWSTFSSESEISSIPSVRIPRKAEAAAWIPEAETPGKLMKSGNSS